MARGNGIRGLLKELQWAEGGPSRSDYESYLREHEVLGEQETFFDKTDLSATIYRDWQRRSQVACVFARKIAVRPGKYDVQTKIIEQDPVKEMTQVVAATADAVNNACGNHEALTVLVPKLVDSKALVAFCKRLGARNGRWSIEAVFNPSDRLERVHMSLRYVLEQNIHAEILGLGPFNFLPSTRRAPITALEIRTKTKGHKKRGGSHISRSHLADINWPNVKQKTRDKDWEQSKRARLQALGGDDSAARARITFAIPRSLWDGHDH